MNTLEAKLFISDKTATIWKEYQAVYNCGTVPVTEFLIKPVGYSGKAYYRLQKVEYNLAYFCTHQNLAELEQTIAHELAHIVQFRCFPCAAQAHGTEFRMILSLAGYKTDTYHQYDVKAAKAAVKELRDQIVLFDL